MARRLGRYCHSLGGHDEPGRAKTAATGVIFFCALVLAGPCRHRGCWRRGAKSAGPCRRRGCRCREAKRRRCRRRSERVRAAVDLSRAIVVDRAGGGLPQVSAALERVLQMRVPRLIFARHIRRQPFFVDEFLVEPPIVRPACSALVMSIDLCSTDRAESQLAILSSFLEACRLERGS